MTLSQRTVVGHHQVGLIVTLSAEPQTRADLTLLSCEGNTARGKIRHGKLHNGLLTPEVPWTKTPQNGGKSPPKSAKSA